MLIGQMKSGLLSAVTVACLWAPTIGLAQNQYDNQASNGLATSQLTAEQQAAQQSYAQQQRRQQQTAAIASPQQQTPTVLPAGFPLTAEHAQYVEKLLDFWEKNSKQVEKYKCGFMRYEYDRSVVAWRDTRTNQLAAHTIVEGEIRFAAPDRARYESTRVNRFAKPPERAGETADYQEAKTKTERENDKERWICDGTNLYDFDFQSKQLRETKIPKDMQGNVTESPLPFIFGAEKKAILERYWVRYAQPTNSVDDEYWLELFPKRAEDARNYSKLEVIIAKEDFLPKAMHMYSAQYDPSSGNETSRYFAFQNREVNSQLAKFSDFFGGFIRPRLPIGWKRVDTAAGLSQRQAATPNGQKPGGGQPMRRE